MASKSKQPKIHVPPEPIDIWITRAAFGILLLMFGTAAYYFNQLPERIPIHFNVKGDPDGYGSKNMIWALPILSTVMFLGMWKVSSIPHLYNYQGKITEENAEHQYRMASRMMRVLNLTIMIMFCYMVWISIRVALGNSGGLGSFFLIITLVGTGLIPLYFILQLSKNK